MFDPRLPLAGLALAAAIAAPVAGQGFKDALPADTLMFVTMPDISTSIGEMDDMPLMKMWRESEVQDFFADSLQMLKEEYQQALEQGREMHEAGMLPVNPDDLEKLRVESFSFALTKMAMTNGGNGGQPMPDFGMLLHMDFGNSASVWQDLVETGLDMLTAQAGDNMERTMSEVGEVKVHSMNATEMDLPMGLHIAFVGNGMLVGTLDSDVRSMLTNLASGSASLTDTAAYKAAVKPLPIAGAEAEMFMRPGGMMDFGMDVLRMAKAMESDFPEELDIDGIERAIQALGLRAVKSIGVASTYDGDHCVSSGFVHAPAPERTGLLTDESKQLDLGFLKWVPKDAVSFSASTMDLASYWSALEAALKAYNPDLAEMAMGELGKMEEQLDMSLRNDLFGAFGNRMVSWSMPMGAFGNAPETVLVMEIKDEARLIETLTKVSQMSEGVLGIDKVERRGITAYQVSLDLEDMGMGMNPLEMMSIVPTFSFKDGHMVCALSLSDVKRAFKRMDREDDPSGDIRSNGEFGNYLGNLPKTELTSLAFTDWKASFEGVYGMLTSLLAIVPLNDDIPFDPSLLPESSTLTQHLTGSVTWGMANADGYITKSIGPFGPEAAVVVLAAVAAGGAVGAYMQAEFR